MKVTIQAIKNITHRNCVRVTEMAYVIVAVFDSGRPQFISKKAIACEVAQWDSGRDSEAFDKEWNVTPKAFAKKAVNPQAAYNLAKSLGCNIREDWWTPVNQGAEKIILRRPTDEQLEVLAAADANWDVKWGVYEIAA